MREAGGEPDVRGIVPDDRDALGAVLSDAVASCDVVIVSAAGKLVGYDTATGHPRWFGPAHAAGYSSPHRTTIDGVLQILLLNGDSFCDADWTRPAPASNDAAPAREEPESPEEAHDARIVLVDAFASALSHVAQGSPLVLAIMSRGTSSPRTISSVSKYGSNSGSLTTTLT